LSEFIRKANLLPPPPDTNPSPPVNLPISSPPPQLMSVITTRLIQLSLQQQREYTHTISQGDISNVSQAITRLPKQSLPTFCGDPLQWQPFWDSFDAAVNANTGLSGVQKFNYLCVNWYKGMLLMLLLASHSLIRIMPTQLTSLRVDMVNPVVVQHIRHVHLYFLIKPNTSYTCVYNHMTYTFPTPPPKLFGECIQNTKR